MYIKDIKDIRQILKVNAPLGVKLLEGSTISGKVLTNENGKGTLKLYDGTIIPAIFISENDVEKDKYIKLFIKGFDGDNFILKLIDDNEDTKNEKSLEAIVRDLNIPADDAKDIVMSLVKYNLPATDENITTIHKNISFLNDIKKMTDPEIIFFLEKHLDKEISENSPEFKITKELFSSLKNIDKNFLSFLLQNDISNDILDIIKTKDFMSNKFFFNSFIDNIKNIVSNINHEDSNPLAKFINLLKAKPSDTEKQLIDALIKNLSKGMDIDEKNIVVSTLEETVNIFKDNKEMFSFNSPSVHQKLVDNFDVLKQLDQNYSFYFFNLYNEPNIFKNNIIIQNKYKGSKYIDVNDVKAFISVDTRNLGIVEGNLYKKNDDISIAFSVNEEFVNLFKNNATQLKDIMKEYGYNIVNISVQKLNKEKSILPFSDFFNDSILKELDVKV